MRKKAMSVNGIKMKIWLMNHNATWPRMELNSYEY
jgi:hypothetical protein